MQYGDTIYKVLWEGTHGKGTGCTTWEPASCLTDCSEALLRFEKGLGAKA